MPKNYITTKALVPVFRTTPSGEIVKDGDKTRIVTVALLGIHVVGTIEGHPEFIWSTFEHVSHDQKTWLRDVAPAAKANPSPSAPVLVEGRARAYALYPIDKARPVAPPVATANNGNAIFGLKLDPKTQTFTPHSAIYRDLVGATEHFVAINPEALTDRAIIVVLSAAKQAYPCDRDRKATSSQ